MKITEIEQLETAIHRLGEVPLMALAPQTRLLRVLRNELDEVIRNANDLLANRHD